MQFTAEAPKVNPIPVPSKPMPVSGQLNKCVHVCVRFLLVALQLRCLQPRGLLQQKLHRRGLSGLWRRPGFGVR